MKPKIGICGFGFVGKAIVHGFCLHSDLKIYDKFQDGLNTFDETVNDSDFIFVCVPTPMHEDGSQDLSAIYDVMDNINKMTNSGEIVNGSTWATTTALSKSEYNLAGCGTTKIIIIKSTVIPGTTRKLANKYPKHSFIFNPEFLTERSAKLDFINTARIVIGGSSAFALDDVEKMYRTRFTHTPIFKTTWEGAELVKYMNNCFFALKISYLNEVYEICEKIGLNYNELKNMFLADQRIGNSHCDIPGHDGDKGFGGKCFIKDINALIKWAEKKGILMDTLNAAIKVNERVRSEKDWEKIKGATTKNNY